MPGGRWMETLPHNLYLVHHFAGALELEGVTAMQGPGVSAGAPVDELMVTLAGNGAIATLHFSSNCNLDRRTLTYTGSDGVIEIVPAGRVALCARTPLDFAKKALGVRYVEALKTLGQMIPDRIDFVRDQAAKLDAHGRNIAGFVEWVGGAGPSPTSAEEIAYVIRMCEQIGDRIDARLAARAAPQAV
jgi:predicted dehydrogenase